MLSTWDHRVSSSNLAVPNLNGTSLHRAPRVHLSIILIMSEMLLKRRQSPKPSTHYTKVQNHSTVMKVFEVFIDGLKNCQIP